MEEEEEESRVYEEDWVLLKTISFFRFSLVCKTWIFHGLLSTSNIGPKVHTTQLHTFYLFITTQKKGMSLIKVMTKKKIK